ncbi:MAG: hypothetical protein WBA44_11665 [Mesorhizobium sp.]
MTPSSDDMNDLTSDLRHLRVLIDVITDMAINIDYPSDQQNEVSDLLWIARDLAAQVEKNGYVCHERILAEGAAARKASDAKESLAAE